MAALMYAGLSAFQLSLSLGTPFGDVVWGGIDGGQLSAE